MDDVPRISRDDVSPSAMRRLFTDDQEVGTIANDFGLIAIESNARVPIFAEQEPRAKVVFQPSFWPNFKGSTMEVTEPFENEAMIVCPGKSPILCEHRFQKEYLLLMCEPGNLVLVTLSDAEIERRSFKPGHVAFLVQNGCGMMQVRVDLAPHDKMIMDGVVLGIKNGDMPRFCPDWRFIYAPYFQKFGIVG